MNILLIQLKRIGDLILTTPAISAIKESFPDAKILLAASQEVSPLIPALSGVDNALIMRRSIADIGRLGSIALTRFEYSVDFTRNNRSALISFLSRANKRIVSYRVKKRAPFRGRAYNEFIEHRMRDMHTVDYNLSLLDPLGINPVPPPPVSLSLPAAADHRSRRRSEGSACFRSVSRRTPRLGASGEILGTIALGGSHHSCARGKTAQRHHDRRPVARGTITPG